MKIGELKTTDAGKTYRGAFRVLNFGASLRLTANTKRGEQSADFLIEALTSDGEPVQVGYAWRKNSDANGRKVAFLSLSMDDPSWDKAINVAAFPADGAPDTLEIQWRRERQQGRAA